MKTNLIKTALLVGCFISTTFVCTADEPQNDPIEQRIYWRSLAGGVAAVGASLYFFRANYGIFPHILAFPAGMLAYASVHIYLTERRIERLAREIEERNQQALLPMGENMPAARIQAIQAFHEQRRAEVRQAESRSA